jgi:hypothetical protein
LTLLFVIGRLAVLLQESVELHEEIDRVEAQTKAGQVGLTATSTITSTATSTPSHQKQTTDEAPKPGKSKQEKKAD